MDIRELINTLNNVMEKDTDVIVKMGDTFTGISHINIGSAGILIHLEAEPLIKGDSTPVNAEPLGAFPGVIRTAADALLDWPEGTRVVDRHDDHWQMLDGVWTVVRWSWQDEDEMNLTDWPLENYLPADVQKEDN